MLFDKCECGRRWRTCKTIPLYAYDIVGDGIAKINWGRAKKCPVFMRRLKKELINARQ